MSRASLPRPLLLLQPSAWWGETKTNDSLLLNYSRDHRGREQAATEACKTSPASQSRELTLLGSQSSST